MAYFEPIILRELAIFVILYTLNKSYYCQTLQWYWDIRVPLKNKIKLKKIMFPSWYREMSNIVHELVFIFCKIDQSYIMLLFLCFI